MKFNDQTKLMIFYGIFTVLMCEKEKKDVVILVPT